MDVLITHINCLGSNFPIARTFVTQKSSFRIICVIISGLIFFFHSQLCTPLPTNKRIPTIRTGTTTGTLQMAASSLASGYFIASASEHTLRQLRVRSGQTPKYHTKGCSRSSVDSPGARTLVFVAFEPFPGADFRASIARTPFCAILWRSPMVASRNCLTA